MMRIRLCSFGKNTIEVRLHPSQCIIWEVGVGGRGHNLSHNVAQTFGLSASVQASMFDSG